MNTQQIGRCTSCEHQQCPHPNIKKLHPSDGCADWQTEQTRNQPAPISEPYEPVKD